MQAQNKILTMLVHTSIFVACIKGHQPKTEKEKEKTQQKCAKHKMFRKLVDHHEQKEDLHV